MDIVRTEAESWGWDGGAQRATARAAAVEALDACEALSAEDRLLTPASREYVLRPCVEYVVRCARAHRDGDTRVRPLAMALLRAEVAWRWYAGQGCYRIRQLARRDLAAHYRARRAGQL